MLLGAVCLGLAACARPEDPARVELRERLRQEAQLSPDELDRLRAEVSRTMGDAAVEIREGTATRPLQPEQRVVVLGMLEDPLGLFDEGPRREGDETFRVLNAPGVAPSSEIDAARRLWIDVETFLPRRFEFSYNFQSPDNYAFDLLVDP